MSCTTDLNGYGPKILMTVSLLYFVFDFVEKTECKLCMVLKVVARVHGLVRLFLTE